MQKLFNDNWQFTKQEIGTELVDLNSDTNWADVDIPHDWLIYDTNNLYESSTGWYKKVFEVSDLEQKHIIIRFEAVYMDTTVYINDQIVGTWKYGYSTFEFDITEYLHEGENTILVQVNHQAPNSRWYSGAGIYRNVWLRTTTEDFFVSDGIYINTSRDDNNWTVEIESELNLATTADATVKQTILDAAGNEVASTHDIAEADHASGAITQVIVVDNPQLWGVDNPNLYTLKSELIVAGTVVDSVDQRIGFRELRFDAEAGFFLNDKHVKMNGVCLHHDLGSLGAAMNKVALRRKLLKMQEMGVNAVRTAHNMPSVELMDLADEMGILIVTEAFDMWERPKTTYDYARFFPEWHERDIASWVRRDRNHASLIMWSIGNEIYDTHAGTRGHEVAIDLRKHVEEHDPKKNAIVTLGSNFLGGENTQRVAEDMEAVGYNYDEILYDSHDEKYPHWVIYGSETLSTLQSRGIYHFPLSQSILSDEDEQGSALGNSTTSWGAKNIEYAIIADRDAEFSLGQFIWTGGDYIGEPTPYDTKNSYFGQIDTAGFEKDGFYMFQSAWRNYKEKPVVHILPYWDFNEGQLIDLRVFTNVPEIELFLNGESLGKQTVDALHGDKFSVDWQIPYTKGTLTAIGYDENGEEIARDEQSSFTDATQIVLEADKTTLQANGQDLIFVEISTIDADGNHVANANNRINIEVEGPARLLGLDNGDSTDFEQYKASHRRLFSGKLLAIIASTHEAGEIKINASSRGLAGASLELEAETAEIILGSSSALTKNEITPANDEVPIRKIELISDGVRNLDAENMTSVVTAEVYPKNATYHDLEWKVINNKRIETNVAELSVEGDQVTITAQGDGDFRLRCIAKNGSDKAKVISELEYSISGLGDVNIDPYSFIAGGLYSSSNRPLANGNEQGVYTSNSERSEITFKNVDFGDFGADTFTMPVFYNESTPLPIEVWTGIPGGAGSKHIDTVSYQADAVWALYQENTFKLAQKIRGVQDISFVLSAEVHIKGFVFEKLDKTYSKLIVSDIDDLYGDSFEKHEETIEKIGNNVSIEFDNMDFSEAGISQVSICGRSNSDINTMILKFTDSEGTSDQTLEFTYSEDYVVKSFPLPNLKAEYKLSLVFLPGSNFDFKWIKFDKA